MWWVLSAIAGIFGAAQVILDALRKEAARERQQWENDYKKREAEIQKAQREIESTLSKKFWGRPNVKELELLRATSAKLADLTYKDLTGARKTLDAMGNAIVQTARKRKEFEEQKRHAPPQKREQLEKEIRSLHKLRDEMLIPDKDKVKGERDHLLAKVQMLNRQTAQLRDRIKSM